MVCVPDFSGAATRKFEARTALLLATWLEHCVFSTDLELHLACIGRPPGSIKALAERCGAAISIHEPLRLEHEQSMVNKLRGLELDLSSRRLLLLDADVTILDDLTPLLASVPAQALAASPTELPRVPAGVWRQAYADLGLPEPSERFPCRELQLGIVRFPRELIPRLEAMFPAFNSGVIHVPDPRALHDMWLRHFPTLAAVRARTTDDAWRWHKTGDEPAFATATHALRLQGQDFAFLPDEYHLGWRHLYCRAPSLKTMRILHMTGSFRRAGSAPISVGAALLDYQRLSFTRFARTAARHPNAVARVHSICVQLPGAILRTARLARELRRVAQLHLGDTL